MGENRDRVKYETIEGERTGGGRHRRNDASRADLRAHSALCLRSFLASPLSDEIHTLLIAPGACSIAIATRDPTALMLRERFLDEHGGLIPWRRETMDTVITASGGGPVLWKHAVND